MIKKIVILLCITQIALACDNTPAPAPAGPVPSARQLAWHKMEFYAFVHFNMNTFSDKEWGFGDELPALFNPDSLDCRQWARVARDAGMKGIILTAKHHDGFCLWPSKYTEHSVKNSPWKNGQGDVVRELSDACREYGLKFGIYLSPWDRNHADYGTPAYITYFRNQLRELLTNYGDIFEVWFDGANGGTGYYGGANEERKIDNTTYYDWKNTRKIVRELQPDAVMFSDGGPDVRWVGNESGWAGETNWSLQKSKDFYPGVAADRKDLTEGQIDGTDWVPAEVDVSIRPGWFYHASEDHKVKSLKQLVDIYYHSIGRNASFLLNLPVDNHGLVHKKDVEQLMKLREVIDRDFANNLAKTADIQASNTRGNSSKFHTGNAIDQNPETYWASDDGVNKTSLTLDFGKPTTFNRFLVQEYIALGQRVKAFSLEAQVDGNWQEIDRQTTIGYKRILRFDNVTADKLRLNILDAKACPTISNIGVYLAPKLLEPPAIQRDKNGLISMNAFDTGLDIYFTTDGSQPTKSSSRYAEPFDFTAKGTVRAICIDPATGDQSCTSRAEMDICKAKWRVITPNPEKDPRGKYMIDAKTQSIWKSNPKKHLPQEVVIDLGEKITLHGFTYLPTQQRYIDGTISHFHFYASKDGKRWGKALAEGEFSNIQNNPVLQSKTFDPVQARYIKYVADREIKGKQFVTIAELGVLTQ